MRDMTVSEEVRDRLDRAEYEMRRASEEYYNAWMAYHREAYARAEMADANGVDPPED